MELITPQQLCKDIAAMKGATFATVALLTTPEMLKTKNPYFGRIQKVQKLKVILNFNYQNSVNNQLKREGKADSKKPFKADPLPYAKHVSQAVLKHNDKEQDYLMMKVEDRLGEIFLLDGLPIEKAKIEPFLPKPKKNLKQQVAGVEKEVDIRTPKFSSIKVIVLKKKSYAVMS